MSITKAITLRLDATDYERLEGEANRRGIAPATLARAYVRAGLHDEADAVVARDGRLGLDALRQLAALRQRLPDAGPQVDIVEIIAVGREERDRRLGH